MRARWRRRSAWLVVGAAAALGVYLASRGATSPAAELRGDLARLAEVVSAPAGDLSSARAARILAAVERVVAPGVSVQVAEAPDLGGDPAALTAALVGLAAPGELAMVELTAADVEVNGDAASARVEVRVAGDVGRDLHARQRTVALRLRRTADQWQIVAIDMSAVADPEPEARP